MMCVMVWLCCVFDVHNVVCGGVCDGVYDSDSNVSVIMSLR